MIRNRITAERLRELLHYDAMTGQFTRLVASGYHGSHGAGKTVGRAKQKDGYVYVGVDGDHYLAHRLAWLYVNGEWPRVTDHINGDRADNRITNLRSVSQLENVHNVRSARSNSKSQLLGAVYLPKRRVWTAQIVINGKNTWLGYFATGEAAYTAHVEAKRKHHAGSTV